MIATGVFALLLAIATFTLYGAKIEESARPPVNVVESTSQRATRELDKNSLSVSTAQQFDHESKDGVVLWLVGTIVSEPAEHSVALIADEHSPGGTNYKIGDELPDGSLLKAVYENEAHVSLVGETRILYIDGFDDELQLVEPGQAAQPNSGWKGSYEDATYNDQTEDE